MIARKLIRLATVVGAAVFLFRVTFVRSERAKAELAMRALDEIE